MTSSMFDPAPESEPLEPAPPVQRQPDPFDLESLRLSQDFVTGAGTKKVLTRVSVRKPDRRWFIRTRPESEWMLTTAIYTDRDDNAIYLVAPHMRTALADEIAIVTLYTAITTQGVLFLWPVRFPEPDGRANAWHQSALAAAEASQVSWVSVRSNMPAGQYDLLKPQGTMPDPEWPEDVTFQDLIRLGFSGRLIDSERHPLVQKLRGEAW